MIFDTNALLAFVDGDRALGAILSRQSRACIPVIVLAEFRYGIVQSRQRAAHEQWLARHLTEFEVLAVTDATAATAVCYADVRLALKRRGTPIPANDAWIAAVALEHRLPILSRDTHFDAVTDIERRDW